VISMNYKELFHWADEFQRKYKDEEYKRSLLCKDVWHYPATITIRQTKKVVIPFLHKWARMGRVVGKGKAGRLTGALKRAAPLFHVLADSRLEDISFCHNINVQGKRRTVADIIKEIFDELSNVAKWTATSKIMHMVNPHLFVMWDQEIREKAGCWHNAEGYLNFMSRVQQRFKEVINSYCTNHGCSRVDAVKQISDKYGKPLTKLMDENNWLRIKKKRDPHYVP